MNLLGDILAAVSLLPGKVVEYSPPMALVKANRDLQIREAKPGLLQTDRLKLLVSKFRELLKSGRESDLTKRDVRRLAWALNSGEPSISDSDELLPALSLIESKCESGHLLGLITTLIRAAWLPDDNFAPWAAIIRKELKKYDGPVDDLHHWKAHADLLFALDSPARVGRWALEQDRTVGEALNSLRVGQNTVLLRRSLEGVVNAVASSPKFPARVIEVIKATQANPEIFKKAVDAVLCRYADQGNAAPDQELIAMALRDLGDPRLERSTSWGDISKKARRQMSTWISREDIELFFQAVAMDSERKRFWLGYVDQMHFSRNILGSIALNGSDPVLREYLKQRDRYALLDDQGGSSAFIIGIGKLLVVEFSETGDACYLYPDDQHGINTIKSGRPGQPAMFSKAELKNRRVRHERIIHRAPWMERARDQLESYGVFSSGKKAEVDNPWKTRHVGSLTSDDDISPEDFVHFVSQNNLRFQDLRPKGGGLWVYADNRRAEVCRTLEYWGFRYKADRGWWKN